MKNEQFDKKIADLLIENENEFPKMPNKEHVWNSIEKRLPKKNIKKGLYFIISSAVACACLFVGVFIGKYQNSHQYIQQMTLLKSNQVFLIEKSIQSKNEEKMIVEKDIAIVSPLIKKQNRAHKSEIENVNITIPEPSVQIAIVEQHFEQENLVENEKIEIRVSLSPRKDNIVLRRKIFSPLNFNLTSVQTEDAKKNTENLDRMWGFRIPFK